MINSSTFDSGALRWRRGLTWPFGFGCAVFFGFGCASGFWRRGLTEPFGFGCAFGFCFRVFLRRGLWALRDLVDKCWNWSSHGAIGQSLSMARTADEKGSANKRVHATL